MQDSQLHMKIMWSLFNIKGERSQQANLIYYFFVIFKVFIEYFM
jgi:hypothetical protein